MTAPTSTGAGEVRPALSPALVTTSLGRALGPQLPGYNSRPAQPHVGVKADSPAHQDVPGRESAAATAQTLAGDLKPMRFAYADPPYPGKARKHYAAEATASQRTAAEVDYPALIMQLTEGYPDGWALSCNSTNLRDLLPLCPATTRVMPWIKRFAKIKPGVNPVYAWEPVLVNGGRKHPRDAQMIRDWVDAVPIMASAAIIGPKVVGQKPPTFCWWLFSVLNAQPGDELDDLFPGSGAVTREWAAYCAQPRLPKRAASGTHPELDLTEAVS